MTTAEEFARWLVARPDLWARFCAVVAEYRAAGHTRWSADAALHAVRWSTGAHIKNAFSPYLARHWLRQHPEAPGFFRTAASMADASPSPQMELGL